MNNKIVWIVSCLLIVSVVANVIFVNMNLQAQLDIDNLTQDNEELTSENADLQWLTDALITERDNALADLEDLQTSNEELNSEISDLVSERDTLKAQVSTLIVERDDARTQVNNLIIERDDAIYQVNNLIVERDDALANSDSLQVTNTELNNEIAVLNNEISNLNSQIGSLNTQINSLTEQLHTLSTPQAMLDVVSWTAISNTDEPLGMSDSIRHEANVKGSITNPNDFTVYNVIIGLTFEITVWMMIYPSPSVENKTLHVGTMAPNETIQIDETYIFSVTWRSIDLDNFSYQVNEEWSETE